VVQSYTRTGLDMDAYHEWWLGSASEKRQPVRVLRVWQQGKRLLASLEGVDNRTQAEALKGAGIWIPDSCVPVDEDEHLWEDLIGCEVYRADTGELLGIVSGMQNYGAQDILCVRTPTGADVRGEWLLPFIEEVIRDVDLDAGRIEADLPEGMVACFTPRS